MIHNEGELVKLVESTNKKLEEKTDKKKLKEVGIMPVVGLGLGAYAGSKLGKSLRKDRDNVDEGVDEEEMDEQKKLKEMDFGTALAIGGVGGAALGYGLGGKKKKVDEKKKKIKEGLPTLAGVAGGIKSVASPVLSGIGNAGSALKTGLQTAAAAHPTAANAAIVGGTALGAGYAAKKLTDK